MPEKWIYSQPLMLSPSRSAARTRCEACAKRQREFFIDNQLVRIHFIIETIWLTSLAPWEFGFPFPGSLVSTFLGKIVVPPFAAQWGVLMNVAGSSQAPFLSFCLFFCLSVSVTVPVSVSVYLWPKHWPGTPRCLLSPGPRNPNPEPRVPET